MFYWNCCIFHTLFNICLLVTANKYIKNYTYYVYVCIYLLSVLIFVYIYLVWGKMGLNFLENLANSALYLICWMFIYKLIKNNMQKSQFYIFFSEVNTCLLIYFSGINTAIATSQWNYILWKTRCLNLSEPIEDPSSLNFPQMS